MSSRPAKKVHYTSSTKGSDHGGPPSTPPLSSRPTFSTRRPSISHQRRPSDSGVGSSSSNSATAGVNSTSFYTDAERSEQRQNVRALNEVVNTLKDRVQTLEAKNLNLEDSLAESNREKRELRREYENFRRTVEESRKEKSRAKDAREAKESDGIRVRGSDIKTTPEKRDRERASATVERNTPPMSHREKERDSEARKSEERLRSQHQNRERRTSYAQAPPSPLYRDDRDANPISPNSRYRDEERDHAREKRNSGTTPPLTTNGKLPNPFTPISPIGSSANAGRSRRASVSYGTSPGGYTSASQGFPGMTVGSGFGRRERDEVPYVRGEVPVSINVGIAGGSRGSRTSGGSVASGDDLFPNDGKYHPYPL